MGVIYFFMLLYLFWNNFFLFIFCFYLVFITMEEIKKNNSVYYQLKLHHRQQLRQQILPQTIDRLEINQNPSIVTRKAFKSLYQDQLQKQIDIRNSLKNQTNALSSVGLDQNRNKIRSNSLFQNVPKMKQSSTGKQFRDFDKQKCVKINQHVNLNYDGGTAFYKSSQLHQNMRERSYKATGVILRAQLDEKTKYVSSSKETKKMQQKARQNQLVRLKIETDKQKIIKQKQKENIRNQIIGQIKQQRAKKQSKQKFNYNNIARHNPITNPIPYHIENPYILKQIQDRQNILHI